MSPDARNQARSSTERRRRAPSEPTHVQIPFDHDGKLGDDMPHGPIKLALETTDAEGTPADWFDDLWWTEVVQRWGDDPVTLHIAPTPAALLNPIVLHQLEMVRRVAPGWRVVGHAYTDDISTDEAVATAAGSAYDEIRFLDRPRPGASQSDRHNWQLSLGELFARIRRAQAEMNAAAPILVRLPSDAPFPDSASAPTESTQASAS